MNEIPTNSDYSTITGTIGGTLLTIGAIIQIDDIVKTIILASIGAIVSFFISRFLKWCWDLFKSK